MTVAECTGECCRRFPLSGMTFEELCEKQDTIRDGAAIVAMVMPIDDIGIYGEPLFVCKHWDSESKRCKEYDSRPRICSEYPYERKCEHCGGKIQR